MNQHSVPHTLDRQFQIIRESTQRIERVEKFKDELIEVQSKNLTPRYYRYVTFTAQEGSPIRQQIRDLSAAQYTEDTGKELATLAGGSEKFPKLTDAGLKSFISEGEVVPKGKVRQYYCYLDHNKKAEVVGFMDFPKGCFGTEQAAHVIRQLSRFMLRMENFDLTTINNRLRELRSEFDEKIRDISKVIEFMIRNDNHRVEGIETFCRDATTKASIGGILVCPKGTEDSWPIYCSMCFAETLLPAIKEWPKSGQSITFPPIPEMSFGNEIYCTENLTNHRKHGREGCLELPEVREKINAKRQEVGEDEIVTIIVEHGLKTTPGWKWIGIYDS